VLSDAELSQIHAYLSSIPKNKTVEEIPLLKALSTPAGASAGPAHKGFAARRW
jgi:hypothetical protein